MYLELRPRPMSREHARPQPPAASRRYGGGVEEPAPVPVGVTGHRTQRPRGQVGPPGPHHASRNPGGEGRTAANTAASGPSDRAASLLLLFFACGCGCKFGALALALGAPSVPPVHCQDLRKAKLPYRQLNSLSSQLPYRQLSRALNST
jgi:hypothetical protein